ncbi:MAG: sigma-54 dependent transcriptional regulator [Planctomycetota bacterium]
MPRVLVVDDDVLIRSLMEEELPDRGFDVETVESGSAALDRVQKDTYDVVLLDQLMPGLSGIDVLKEVRQAAEPPEVVFLTADESVEPAVEAMKNGACDYIQKPCEIDELEVLLKQAAHTHQLNREVSALRGAFNREQGRRLSVHSPQMKELMRIVKKCAPTDSTVLIQGETGTGKELVAGEICRRSLRHDKPFIPVNCAALHEQLLESELFGHEKGAFTSANAMRHGLFEVADGGTIFLDEIGEMDPKTQVKLLRVLQSGEVRRVGSNRVRHVDARVIASTNKDLAREAQEGRFREDLFYRLSVLTVRVPPLRERTDEIPPLIDFFLAEAAARQRAEPKELADDAREVLLNHDWPGNVRELENVVELAVVLSDRPVIEASDLPPHLITSSRSRARSGAPLSLEQVEMEHLLRVLKMNGGNKRKTARDLGIDAKTLYNKLKKINANG